MTILSLWKTFHSRKTYKEKKICFRHTKLLESFISHFRWIVYNSDNAPENPCFFCDQCFKAFHYDEHNRKIGNFKAYKYFDQSAAINL